MAEPARDGDGRPAPRRPNGCVAPTRAKGAGTYNGGTYTGKGGAMGERIKAFVTYVMAHPGATVSDLAEHFSVSTRTIRNYAKQADYALADAARLVVDRGRCSVDVSDMAALRALLAGKDPSSVALAEDVEQAVGGTKELSGEASQVAGAMVDAVARTFDIDLRDDLELCMNLARHIEPLGKRLASGEQETNPLLADTKARYPLGFAMAARTADVLVDAYGVKPNEDELGYLALAFALALDRQSSRTPHKNVLIVCATGRTSARMLEHRIRQSFGQQLGTVELCDKDDVLFHDLSHVDYVFTTVPLDAALPVPTVTISYFFDEDEADAVRDILSGRPEEDIAGFFPVELFCAHLPAATKEEALHELCEMAAAEGLVGDGFEDAVWARERAASTALGGGVALPHPLGHTGEKTFVAVGLLDHPVVWDGTGAEVNAVFLVGFGAGDGDRFEGLFGRIANFITDRGAVDELLRERTRDALGRGLHCPLDGPAA